MPFHIFHSSGGAVYHYRAMRFRKSAWSGFRDQISQWILLWMKSLESKDLLVIIGGSAGHCFPFEGLAQFKKVVLIDPDPMGALWFRWRTFRFAPRTKVIWKSRYWPVANFPKDWSAQTPLLFSNVLGQLQFNKALSPGALDAGLRKWIGKRPFLSFHDRFSGDLEPLVDTPLSAGGPIPDRGLVHGNLKFDSSHPMNIDQILQEFYSQKSGELEPHFEYDFSLLQPVQYRYFSWPLRPGYWHLIEGVCSLTRHV